MDEVDIEEPETPSRFVPELGQHFCILDEDGAAELVRAQPRCWHVLSITDPGDKPRLLLPGALSLLRLSFHDVDRTFGDSAIVMATPGDIAKAMEFAEKNRGRPLLVHCHAGISRSTAVGWVIASALLGGDAAAVARAFEVVCRVRPCLDPNRHILRLGVEAMMRDPAEAEKTCRAMEGLVTSWRLRRCPEAHFDTGLGGF